MGITLDAGTLYWTEVMSSTVQSIPAAGGTATQLADGQSRPSGIIADRGDVFFTNAGTGASDGSVVEVPRAGGAARVLASGYISPFGIAVDASYVYVAVGGAANVSAGSIVRLPR
jgi:hypothetical protein